MSNIKEKIDILKGNRSYQDFAEDIYNKTGCRVHYTTLQKYITGKREPSKRLLKVLADYSKKPISWFLDEKDLYGIERDDFRSRFPSLGDFENVIKEAQAKKIPPSAFKLFIKAVEEAKK